MRLTFPVDYLMEEPLTKLFDRLNKRYWDGKLPPHRVRDRFMSRFVLGKCDRSKRMIWVEVFKHRSFRHLSETLLHEAVHVAERPDDCGMLHHGRGFWEEAENVLRKDAPPGFLLGACVEWPLDPIIFPARLKLCRQAFTKLLRAFAVGSSEAESRRSAPPSRIVQEFRRAATRYAIWKDAYWTLGAKFGLIDVFGKPLEGRARQLIALGKDAYYRYFPWRTLIPRRYLRN